MRAAAQAIRLLPGAVGLAGVLLLAGWLGLSRDVRPLQERLPNPDTAKRAARSAPPVNLSGTFQRSGELLAVLPGFWPGFRGPNLDGVADGVTLARSWGSEGPRPVWSIDVGEGHAGAAVLDGRLFLLDYDQANQRDAIRCLSLADGTEIWQRSYRVKIKRNHGMSRTVPAVSKKYLVTLGPKCHVVCCEPTTGKYLWGMDLVRQFGTKVPPWYGGQCPLLDGDRVIIAPGGSSLMIAVEAATGKIVWKTPNPHGWGMSHSSIVPMTYKGRRMYVYCASGGVVGVDADCGAILWDTDAWKISIATVPSPVVIGGGRLLLSGGYESGGSILQLKEEGGRFSAQIERRFPPQEFGSDQHTPLFYQGYIYGVIPGGQLVCMDPSGRRLWASGSTRRFGLGPYVAADGMIFVLNDMGTLTLVEATPKEYRQLAQARILTGHDSWGPLALADRYLIARDLTRMVCVDVGRM